MLYQGESLHCRTLQDGIVEVVLDAPGSPVNTVGQRTIRELGEALQSVAESPDVAGLLVSSAKDGFVVGADVREFLGLFAAPVEQVEAGLRASASVLNALEDLDVPSVACVRGLALGGGLELALCTDYRVLAQDAEVGFPEVKLGLIPGLGGTVRLPRLIGADNAIEWIATGKSYSAADALKFGAADAVVATDDAGAAAQDLLRRCIAGEVDWKRARRLKQDPLPLGRLDAAMVFQVARGLVGAQAGPHYPAPMTVVDLLEKSMGQDRDGALALEAEAFSRLAKTSVARSLIGIFLGDQVLKRKARSAAAQGRPVERAAVIGAGIMGGGIAHQSASRGVPVVMKDVREEALEVGLGEVARLLQSRVDRGRMGTGEMAEILTRIRATLSYDGLEEVDLVVEAVVENAGIKKRVFREIEERIRDEAVLATNTSTLSIDGLAEGLERPGRFLGMHFFNPVHRMPLVEVIRGSGTEEAAVATTVAYAATLGKSPLVVRDCPGFYVNRVLSPYLNAFERLVGDGVDPARVDRVMEAWGWPMGPAHLLDVIGIDTAHHAAAVMAAAYPERMGKTGPSAIDVLYQADRLGQKNGRGFYAYEQDRKGRLQKRPDPAAMELLRDVVGETAEVDDAGIVERMMVPMVLETLRCLEEEIVSSPAEADLGLVYGIGFPPFRGGPTRFIDETGAGRFCEMAEKHAVLGPLYEPTEGLRRMAESGGAYHPA